MAMTQNERKQAERSRNKLNQAEKEAALLSR